MVNYFQNVMNFINIHFGYLFPFSVYLNSLIIIFSASMMVKLALYARPVKQSTFLTKTISQITRLLKGPMLTFLILYTIYFSGIMLHLYYPKILNDKILNSSVYLIEFVILFWSLRNMLTYCKDCLSQWLLKSTHPSIHIVFNIFSDALEVIFYIIITNIVLSFLVPAMISEEIATKTLRVILIGAIGWVVLKIIDAVEQLITHKTSPDDNIYNSRKIMTQVSILKKVCSVICLIIMSAAILMVFDSVRSIGAGLLTTAGIIGAVGAFASQRSLAGIFSGLHLAFTQPIRIGDTIVVDNESGQVEEITLSYVVIKLWDLRRLILPTDYFTSKGVLNLTRNSSELVGSIILYVDYTLKIDVLREKFNTLINQSPLWDKKTSSFQVTELKEQSVQIRALVSAKNSSDLWNLRCEIREKLLQFIADDCPTILPKTRHISLQT